MFKSKVKASLIHLLLSAVVISAIVSLMILFWFPSPFLGVTNFKDIALILIAIDLVLGPLLTFVVFNPGKQGLRFDLSVIVFLQVIGLSYGIYMLYLTHPVYVTYYGNSFNLITAKQSRPDIAKHDEFKISKLSSPKLAYMNLPDGTDENQLFNDMLDGDTEIEARSDFYEPYDKGLANILANSLDTSLLFSEKNMDDASKKFITKYNNIDDLAFLPLVNGTSNKGVIVLKKQTGEPVTLIKTNPWKYVKKKT